MPRKWSNILSALVINAGIIVLAPDTPAIAAGKSMMDYYLPMPMYQNRLESTGVWGVKNVVPRDIYNGIEDSSCKKWSYWDGKIIKGKDGKYHLYCSRWDQSAGHGGWGSSTAVHAVSDSIMGPYIDKGPLYTWNGGKGHNVTAITLPDGRIAVSVTEIVPLTIFTATDPNGPFTLLSSVQINTNGHNTGGATLSSNWTVCMRDDSSYLAVCRDGFIMLSTTGIGGPYVVKTDKIWPASLAGYNTANWEDPVLWHSGKQYYCTVNSWSSKKAIYMVSNDGITNWTYGGEAYSPLNQNLLQYTNGKKNIWCKMERPNVFLENNVLKYLTFAVVDTEKEADLGNDNHNSKVIVIPFNGEGFDGITGAGPGLLRPQTATGPFLTVECPAPGVRRVRVVPAVAVQGVFEVSAMNGDVIGRIDRAMVSADGIVLQSEAVLGKLSPGMYVLSLKSGAASLQGRLSVP